MKTAPILLLIVVGCLAACNQQPPASSSSPSKPADSVQQKLQEFSGASATDCGRLDVRASAAQSKATSDCALQASQNKRPFYVAYDMPGMAVGIAGNAEGKLFTVQSQGSGPAANVTASNCPAQLRVASSGRVTCFAPGDMGSMSGSHAAGSVAPGSPNPHTQGTQPPSN